MNVDTGELRMVSNEEAKQAMKEGFQPIPPHLEGAAKRKLNGRRSAQVSRTSGGKLSQWAAEQRKHALELQVAGKKASAVKERNNKKAAKQSRKANRR